MLSHVAMATELLPTPDIQALNARKTITVTFIWNYLLSCMTTI